VGKGERMRGDGGEGRGEEAFLVMWPIRLSALNPPLCDYQCTSVSFIILSNRIESNYFSPNRNALVSRSVSSCFAVLRQLRSIRRSVLPAVLQSLVVSLAMLFQLWFFSFSFSYSCDLSVTVSVTVMYFFYFSVSVTVTVVIFQLQLQLLFFSFYFYFS